MAKFNILSFDGGGIKGLVSVILMERLVREVPGLLDRVGLFAGTSTGGIVALGLASGLPLSRMRELYEQKAKQIFKHRWQTYFGLTGAKYDNSGLKLALAEVFGAATLDSLPRKALIPTYQLKSPEPPYQWGAKFFHNLTPEDGKVRIADLALWTSSAPTYFKASDGYADGGMAANDPAMCAVAQALDCSTGGQKLDDIACLSIGTSLSFKYIGQPDYDFGGIEVKTLVDMFMSGMPGIADYQCRAVLGQRYSRLNPADSRNTEMDDIGAIPWLVELASSWPIGEQVAWAKANW